MNPEAPVFISSTCNSKNSFAPLSVINSPREVSVHNYKAYLMHVSGASHWAKHSTLFMSFNPHTSSGSPYLFPVLRVRLKEIIAIHRGGKRQRPKPESRAFAALRHWSETELVSSAHFWHILFIKWHFCMLTTQCYFIENDTVCLWYLHQFALVCNKTFNTGFSYKWMKGGCAQSLKGLLRRILLKVRVCSGCCRLKCKLHAEGLIWKF